MNVMISWYEANGKTAADATTAMGRQARARAWHNRSGIASCCRSEG